MMDALAPLLIFAAIAGFATIVIVFAIKQQKATLAKMSELAARLGLDLVGNGRWQTPRLAGEQEGRRVEINSFTTGSGKSRRIWARAAVSPRAPVGLRFSLTHQGFGTKIAELFGQREITVGDPAFDRQWFIRTNRPEYLQAALLPELRERITAAVRAGAKGRFELQDGAVTYIEQGGLHSDAVRERLAALLPLLTDLAIVAESAE